MAGKRINKEARKAIKSSRRISVKLGDKFAERDTLDLKHQAKRRVLA